MVVRVGIGMLGGSALMLAACGNGTGGGGIAGTGGGWDGTKACDYLKQADVEAVTGRKSAPGKLDGVVPAANGGAAVSICSYDLADGRNVGLLTRVSSGQDMAATVDSIRNPPPGFAIGKNVDLPGVGKAALWNDETHQLNFWLDGDHYGVITFARGDYTKRPDLSASREQAIALAHRLGA